MHMKHVVFAAALVAMTPVVALADRVVSVGGTASEIIFALGEGERVVGRDTTTTYPPEALALPDVGYIRRLSPEGVMSLAPDLIIMEAGAGPVETMDLLRAASIPMVELPGGFGAEDVAQKIRVTAKALGVAEKGEELAAQVEADFDAAAAEASESATRAKTLFILGMTGGRITAAGHGVSAHAMIELAGGTNVLADVEGWKQVSDEAILAAQPDVIVIMSRGGDHGIPDEDILSHPALSTTPAAQNKAIARVDTRLVLGFGPRTGEAITTLAADLANAVK